MVMSQNPTTSEHGGALIARHLLSESEIKFEKIQKIIPCELEPPPNHVNILHKTTEFSN